MPEQERNRPAERQARAARRLRVPAWIAAFRLLRSDTRAGQKRNLRPYFFRLFLFTLSAGGVVAGGVLWFAGHGYLALRVLAAVVLLAIGLLLIV